MIIIRIFINTVICINLLMKFFFFEIFIFSDVFSSGDFGLRQCSTNCVILIICWYN